MIIRITDGRPQLTELDQFTDFSVHAAGATLAETEHALSTTGWGTIDTAEIAHVRVDAVLSAAAEHGATAGWRHGFDTMLRYAEQHGWLGSDRTTVAAHVTGLPDAVECSKASQPARIVLVGVGSQGAEIANEIVRLRHHLVGAVDIGTKVGRSIRDFTVGDDMPDLVISAQLEETLDQTSPNLVILAAAVPLDSTLELAGIALDRGINVLTLQQDVLCRDDTWAIQLDRRARDGGASIMASGVQDIWWVHLPALLAASSLDVSAVRVSTEISLESLSHAVGAEIGVMLTATEFSEFEKKTAEYPSVLGAPLVEAARRMGLHPGPVSKRTAPSFPGATYSWDSAGITIPSERTCGFTETVQFTTDEGVYFEGTVAVQPVYPHETQDEIHINGRPDLHAIVPGLPGHQVTTAALVARIPDVIAAPAGALFSAELHPPRTQRQRRHSTRPDKDMR